MRDLDHIERVTRVITADMVKHGLSETVAPTPAREAAERIFAGEPAGKVVDELVKLYGGAPGKAKGKPTPAPAAVPVGPEPLHVRMAREAGRTAANARTAANRVSEAVALGNPWGRDSFNVTRQQLVAGLDPDRAAQLRSEAGR